MSGFDASVALTDYLAARLARYLSELSELCAIECPTACKPGVDAAGSWVRAWADKRGWPARSWADPDAGNSVLVSLAGDRSEGPSVLLAAHLDTVYPVGTAADRPVRRDGDRLIGPGTCDNKSGLLSALHAMAALEDLEFQQGFASVDLFCGGDEETDMRSSLVVMRELAPQYAAALVLEAGRENGDIVGARKGNGQFVLEVTGHAAHAGVEPHRGANAIVALAQQVTALQLLNGMPPGVSVNVGTIRGGTVSNVVPDSALAEIDVRVARTTDMEPVEQALQQIARSTQVPGTSGVLRGGWKAPPMDRTPEGDALVALAERAAHSLGFEVRAASTGGVSYANYFSELGLPVIDGLGPIGGLDHSPDEYILASSIVPRTALLARLIQLYAESV